MKRTISTALLLISTLCCYSQQGALKAKNPYHVAYHDSLKAMNYTSTFPLLGAKAYKKGFDIQFPWGVGAAFFAQRQQVNIQNTQISFNDGAPVDLTNIIQFGHIENKATAYTIRPSLWILPFLNLYGVFGTGRSETTVPLVKPIDFTTVQSFDVQSAGVGATLAGGIGQIIIIIDQNYNWANLDAFVEPVPAYNLDMRIGHNFVNPRRADRSVTIWFGTFFQQIQADTKGTILVSDLLPGLTPDQKEEMRDNLTVWYENLNPIQQAAVRQVVENVQDFLDGRNPGDGRINYFLDKELAGPWNLIFGAQYQHNKHWQMRCEVGTFGKRTQFLLNLNYCFLRFKKK